MSKNWLVIDGKSGKGGGGQSSTNKWGGNTSSYPTSSTQGGGYSTGGTSGGSYSAGSYNSTFLSSYSGYGNSQELGKLYEPEEVLGMSGHTKKNPYGDSETIDQIIEFSRRKSADCWGSNALHHGSGGKDAPQYIKAINLGRTDMHDKDAGNLFYVLRDFNFNLDILNLSNNRIGDLGVESMIYGITSLQYQTLYSAESGWKPYQSNLKTVQSVITINLSNNQIGDKGAYILADHLAKGNLPNTKFIDVSGNHISYEGNTKFAKGLQNMKQDIKILINKVLPINSVTSGVKKQSDLFFGSKEEKHAIIKDYLKHAQNNGVDIKNVTVSKDIFTSAINGGKLGINFTFGWAKCSVVPNDIKTFAADQIIATASKKAGIVNTIIGVVTCYFETFDESGASQQGIQFMNDIGLVGQGEFLENVE